jgi:hypothetical protein
MNKLTITIEKIGDDYYSYVAEGDKGFGELRGCQNAEGIAKMIPIDLRSWVTTQEQHEPAPSGPRFERLHAHSLTSNGSLRSTKTFQWRRSSATCGRPPNSS